MSTGRKYDPENICITPEGSNHPSSETLQMALPGGIRYLMTTFVKESLAVLFNKLSSRDHAPSLHIKFFISDTVKV